jgi:hypothetical protein
MAKVQLLVNDSDAAPRLCVLAGPSFRHLLAALRIVPRRAYAAPDYWVMDTGGLACLRAAGLQVEEGNLEPVLVELAHQMTLWIAGDWLPLWQRSAEDWP